MALSVVYYGDQRLRSSCATVENITQEIKDLVGEMTQVMDLHDGIGIAAPQVGYLLRLFVLRKYNEEEEGECSLSDPKVYINPIILSCSEELGVDFEACLSIPGIREEVERPLRVVVEATNLEGLSFREEILGYNARVFLHEHDHLQGVLFVDRVDNKKRKKLEEKLKRIAAKYAAT